MSCNNLKTIELLECKGFCGFRFINFFIVKNEVYGFEEGHES